MSHPGQCLFKRWQFVDGKVILMPLNPACSAETSDREWIEVIYPVMESRWVRKELLMYTIVYNVVRALMVQSTAERGMPPGRLEFA